MEWKVSIDWLKKNDYKFGKYYASNYKMYKKEIDSISFLCWVGKKDLEIMISGQFISSEIIEILRLNKDVPHRLAESVKFGVGSINFEDRWVYLLKESSIISYDSKSKEFKDYEKYINWKHDSGYNDFIIEKSELTNLLTEYDKLIV